jgi:uncharacterized protein YdeI (YjbR/CyaY-like superfamily)
MALHRIQKASAEELDFRGFEAFYAWLSDHHDTAKEASLLIYKKDHQDRGISYEQAVRAALCWGWIDSVTRSRDEACFVQRFSPRKPNGRWAASNIRRMKELIETGQMTDAGLRTFDKGLLDRLDEIIEAERVRREQPAVLPASAQALLDADPEALTLFRRLPPSHRRQYATWIGEAKREDTKLRRTRKMMQMLRAGKGPSTL